MGLSFSLGGTQLVSGRSAGQPHGYSSGILSASMGQALATKCSTATGWIGVSEGTDIALKDLLDCLVVGGPQLVATTILADFLLSSQILISSPSFRTSLLVYSICRLENTVA